MIVNWPATCRRLLSDTVRRWLDDDAPSKGAALAYYTLFSMAPLLLIVMALVGAFVGDDAARAEIEHQLTLLIGAAGAQAVAIALQATAQPAEGALAAAIGGVTLLIGATSVFAELENSLNRIWRSPDQKRAEGWWAWLRGRLLSLGLLLAIGFLLVVSLVATAALAALERWWSAWFGDWIVLAHTIDFAVSFAFLTVVFSLIYKWMPHARLAWRDVMLGAVFTALLFTLGKLAIGAYIGRSGVASAYGAAASVVVLLLWIYYSAQIFLFGAEFTWVYAQHRRKPLDCGAHGLAVQGRTQRM
jgi:membrane protein